MRCLAVEPSSCALAAAIEPVCFAIAFAFRVQPTAREAPGRIGDRRTARGRNRAWRFQLLRSAASQGHREPGVRRVDADPAGLPNAALLVTEARTDAAGASVRSSFLAGLQPRPPAEQVQRQAVA